MTVTTVRVRDARLEDAYPLWVWSNDHVTRSASHGRAEIPWTEHRRWLLNRLVDPATVLLIAETVEACPVGTIRFESTDGWSTARLSYGLAPEARGRGLSQPLIRAGMDRLRNRYPRTQVFADVLEANTRSWRAFRGLDWEEGSLGGAAVRFWCR
jgi:UDP-2,4-diacetamido-2,4,6-trideoxy-beta-L-altropyranose hydrolase